MSKIIKISNKYETIVDDDDYEKLIQYKWRHFYNKNTGNVYVIGKVNERNIGMHRFIMNAPSNLQVDRINHNVLDNRKTNLRLCTASQNAQNTKIRKHTSKYKGVYFDKQKQKWRSRIMINKKLIHLGLFEDEVEAALSYNNTALKLFGTFAFLNNI
jgi:hypothetical protein